MTTTKRSNFGAALRTTLLLAGLGGILLVVIGALIGGPTGRARLPVIALVLNLMLLLVQRQDRARSPRAPSRSRRRTTRASTRWSAI